MMQKKLYAVVMAGGRGERFWPAGRQKRPKQLLPLLSERSMIEETVQRLFPLIAPENLLVIANGAYVEEIRRLLPVPPENVIGEPEGRDTAPCIALATALIRRRDPGATMVVVPADHEIRPAVKLQDALLKAAEAAQGGSLVTVGIKPSFASTAYGYLRLGDAVGDGFRRVAAFVEKPDQATAEKFFGDGGYRWNSGIFIWRCESISAAFRKYVPRLGEKVDAWSCGADYMHDFAECEKISIDYAVMEKAADVIAMDAGFYWNDIGSWKSLHSELEPDENGNAWRGRVVALDSVGNLIINDGDEVIGVIGLREMAVIKSGNGILVVPLREEQRVRELVKKLGDLYPGYL